MLCTSQLSIAKTASQFSFSALSGFPLRCPSSHVVLVVLVAIGVPVYLLLLEIRFFFTLFLCSFCCCENCGTVLAVLCCIPGSSVQQRLSCSSSLYSTTVSFLPCLVHRWYCHGLFFSFCSCRLTLMSGQLAFFFMNLFVDLTIDWTVWSSWTICFLLQEPLWRFQQQYRLQEHQQSPQVGWETLIMFQNASPSTWGY